MPVFKSTRQLRYWYNKWNRQYFDNRLPENTVLYWEPVDGGVAECDQFYNTRREKIDGTWYIRLDPVLRAKKSQWALALFHEMAHLELDPYSGHGKKFDAEMLRLAEAGAFHDIW